MLPRLAKLDDEAAESGEPRPRLPLPEPISFADTNSGEMPPFPVHVFSVIDCEQNSGSFQMSKVVP